MATAWIVRGLVDILFTPQIPAVSSVLFADISSGFAFGFVAEQRDLLSQNLEVNPSCFIVIFLIKEVYPMLRQTIFFMVESG